MFNLTIGIAETRQRVRFYQDRAASFTSDARLLRRAGLHLEADRLIQQANTDKGVVRGLQATLAAMRKDKRK